MMTAFWFLQIGFDAVITVGLIFILVNRTKTKGALSTEKMAAAVSVLESRMRQTEKEVFESRQKWDEKLKSLNRICEEAQKLFSKGLSSDPILPPTQEENELRSVVASKDEIPTLQELQKTRQRLHTEIQLDLRSLLRDQLA